MALIYGRFRLMRHLIAWVSGITEYIVALLPRQGFLSFLRIGYSKRLNQPTLVSYYEILILSVVPLMQLMVCPLSLLHLGCIRHWAKFMIHSLSSLTTYMYPLDILKPNMVKKNNCRNCHNIFRFSTIIVFNWTLK